MPSKPEDPSLLEKVPLLGPVLRVMREADNRTMAADDARALDSITRDYQRTVENLTETTDPGRIEQLERDKEMYEQAYTSRLHRLHDNDQAVLNSAVYQTTVEDAARGHVEIHPGNLIQRTRVIATQSDDSE